MTPLKRYFSPYQPKALKKLLDNCGNCRNTEILATHVIKLRVYFEIEQPSVTQDNDNLRDMLHEKLQQLLP